MRNDHWDGHYGEEGESRTLPDVRFDAVNEKDRIHGTPVKIYAKHLNGYL
jgi:hypothetical protein